MSIETYQLDPVNGMVSIENVVEQQEPMADMTTPISELVNDSEVIQEQSSMYLKPKPEVVSGGGASKKKRSSASLTPEQLDAIVAGIAAIAAFSKPVQSKLADFIPNGGLMLTLASALVAAIIFFFGRRFLAKRQ